MGRLGQRIRDVRMSKGLSLTAVAGTMCTKAHLSAIELGKVCPSPRVLLQICHALDLPIDQVVAEYATEVSDPGSVRSLCELLRVQGGVHKVLPLLEALLEKARGRASEPGLYNELGRAYTCINRFAEAQRAFENALDVANRRAMWPAAAEALFELGIVSCCQGQYKDAIKYLSRSARTTSRADVSNSALLTRFCLATCFLRVGMHKTALDLYEEVCSETGPVSYDGTPLQALAYLGLGVAYYNRQQYGEALRANDLVIKMLRSSASEEKYLADAFNNRAVCLLDLGECDQAESSLRETIKLRHNAGRHCSSKKILFSVTEFARLHLLRRRPVLARRAAEYGLTLAQRYRDVFEQGRLHTLLMALCPNEFGRHKAAISRLGEELTMPEERVYYYSAIGRFLRGTEFEALGTQLLDRAIRESENLSTLRMK